MQFIRGPVRYWTRRTIFKRIAIPVQIIRILAPYQPPYPNHSLHSAFKSQLTCTDRLLHTTTTQFVVVKVPAFAESVIEGDIKFTVKVGDTVQEGDSVMEVETDKTAVPVPATATGKIVEIYVKDGDTVTPGQDLFKIE